MKKLDKIIDGLAQAAPREPLHHRAEMPPGLPTRVLARARARAADAPNFGGVLERWLVGSIPVALLGVGVLWMTGAPQSAPTRAAFDAETAVADAFFEEALRP